MENTVNTTVVVNDKKTYKFKLQNKDGKITVRTVEDLDLLGLVDTVVDMRKGRNNVLAVKETEKEVF